jgi:hypothetical protein
MRSDRAFLGLLVLGCHAHYIAAECRVSLRTICRTTSNLLMFGSIRPPGGLFVDLAALGSSPPPTKKRCSTFCFERAGFTRTRSCSGSGASERCSFTGLQWSGP